MSFFLIKTAIFVALNPRKHYQTVAGIYVHIPFCRSRCAYCDFFSTVREAETAAYVEALCCEIEQRRHELQHAHVQTIYIGGGTPSVLPPSLLHRIFECIYAHYDVDSGAEVTMEVNPDDVNAALLDTVVNEPVNRISFGVQSFNDDLLRLIRRRHDSATAIHAVRALQDVGIDNISIDLIYGLPSQTMEQWESDLETACSLGIQHLSAYALSYEHGTLITRWRDEGRIKEVADEQSVAMYQHLCQRTREAGFEHYEISNFALPGCCSRHNSSYWTGEPYLGFGPGAHSYDGLRARRANNASLDRYIVHFSSPSSSDVKPCRVGDDDGSSVYTLETLTDAELHDEAVMCGLRTCEGIDLQSFRSRFGQARLVSLLRMAEPHIKAQRLELISSPTCSPSFLRLTEHSIMVSDDIMSDLMA